MYIKSFIHRLVLAPIKSSPTCIHVLDQCYACKFILICDVICVAAVRKEISDETDRETGRSKQISAVPIYLSIYSPNGECLRAI